MEQIPTKKCPKCMKEIDVKASKCPYCQSKIYVWTTGRKLLIFLLVPVFIAVVVGMASDPTSTVPIQRTADEITFQKKHDFASLAKMNVGNILKAPSTAKFNTSPTVKFDGKTYSIDSWVDSQNSFGAMTRSYWSAKAHYIGGDSLEETGTGTNWIIDEFIFDGKKIK